MCSSASKRSDKLPSMHLTCGVQPRGADGHNNKTAHNCPDIGASIVFDTNRYGKGDRMTTEMDTIAAKAVCYDAKACIIIVYTMWYSYKT